MQKIKKEICIDFQILCGFLALACFPYTIVGLGGYTFLTINNSFADMSDQRTTENSNRKPMLFFFAEQYFLSNSTTALSCSLRHGREAPPGGVGGGKG